MENCLELAGLLDWLSVELLSVDLERRRVLLASPPVARRLGRAPDELAALELSSSELAGLLEPLFDDEAPRARVRQALGGVLGLETSFEYRSGTPARWRRARVRIVSTPAGRRFDLATHDITDVVESERAARAAELVRRTSEVIHGADDLGSAARAAAEILRAHFDVDRCSVTVFDELRGALGTRGVSGPDVDISAEDGNAMVRFFLGLHGPLAQFTDVAEVPGARPDMLDAMGIRSVAFAQIGAGTRPVGSISLGTRERRTFDADQMQLLGQLAEAMLGPLARKAFSDERRHAQARVLEAEGRLRAALEASGTGTFEIEVATGLLRLDEPSRLLLDLEVNVLPRTELLERVDPDDLEAMRRAAQAALSGAHGSVGASVQFRYEGRRGTRWLDVHGRVQLDANGKPERLVGTVRDVSEERRLEARLVATQKLESLGVLAGGIAHDFNNLLVGVLGNAGLAKLVLPPDSPVLESIAGIETAAQRAAELTRQLLAYAGKARVVISRIDLRNLIEEMGHLLHAVIGKGVVLRYQFGRDVPLIDGDATQLRQVVMNLITNASDAIGDRDGLVTISTSLVDADPTYLAETLFDDELVPGRYVCLQVADTGSGMDAETRARIFEPFFTTKFTGRGLGLAAVLGILRVHRGGLKVYSEPGHGATFRILLPAAELAESAPVADEPRARVGATSGGTILLVDDEPAVRTVTARILEHAGYRVLEAVDGVDGLDVFRAHRREISAVILDATMPRMGGEETFRELRRLAPELRVVLVSGFSEQEATSAFAGKGLAGFLEKPFRPEDLLAKLARVLES